MTVQDLIVLLENRLRFLQGQRLSAVQRGDVAGVQAADAETASTQATLNQLLTLV